MTASFGTAKAYGQASPQGMLRRPARRSNETAPSWQFVAVGLIVAALGMRVFEFFPSLAVIKPVMLVVGASLALFAVSTEGRSLTRPLSWSFTRWFLALFAWMILCVPSSVWVSASVGALSALIPTVAGIWVILALPKSRAASERVQFGFVASAVVFAVLNVAKGGEQFAGRYGGAIGMDVNDIALVLAVSLPLALGVALRASGFKKIAFWAAAAFIAVVIMRTGSRGGALALVAGVLVLLAGLPWRRSIQFALLGVPIALAVWTTAPESFRERMSSFLAGEEDYNQTDNNGRIAIWKRGFRYGVQHPIFGVGPGGFETQDGIGKAEMGLSGKWSAAHNTYVQIFAELGFPGLFFFLACVGTVAKSSLNVFRNRRLASEVLRPEYLASLAAFLVGATFLSFLLYQITWLLLASLAVMAGGAIETSPRIETARAPATRRARNPHDVRAGHPLQARMRQ